MAASISTYLWISQGTFLLLASALVWVAFVFNVIVLGKLLPGLRHGTIAVVLKFSFNTLLSLTLWSLVKCRYADPGFVPPEWKAFVTNAGPLLPIAPARKEWQPRKATMCMKCRFPRPERAHHCTICDCCILRYDHHCPWINNCVGFKNHKFFLQLTVYGCLTSTLVLLTTIPLVPSCIHGLVVRSSQAFSDDHSSHWFNKDVSVGDAVLVMCLVTLAIISCWLLCTLLQTHLPLSLRNATTVEDYYENMPNPFDQGSRIENLGQTFGTPGLDWFLPIAPWRPITDGVTYPDSTGLGPTDPLSCDCLMDATKGTKTAFDGLCSLSSDGVVPSSDMLLCERTNEIVPHDESAEFPRPDGRSRNDPKVADERIRCSLGPEDRLRLRYRLRTRSVAAPCKLNHEENSAGSPVGGASGSSAVWADLWASFWQGRISPTTDSSVWL